MVRVVGSPLVLGAVGLCVVASAWAGVLDSPITRLDSPTALKKFLMEKVANSEM